MVNIFAIVNELLQKQETFALATIINYKGSVPRRVAKMVITKDMRTYGSVGGDCVEGQVAQEAAKMLREGSKGVVVKSYDLVEEEFGGVGMSCGGRVDIAIEVIEPEPRLIIAGSGHLSNAICSLAHLLGFEVIIIDALAEKASFPEANRVISDFFENNLSSVTVTVSTYIVIVTRHKDDLPSLRVALKSKAGYIGLIGSKRRVSQTFELLGKEGFTEEELNRVNAPIGLDIGAETPEEIALSIMAEITQRRRKGGSQPANPKKIKFTSVKTIAEDTERTQLKL